MLSKRIAGTLRQYPNPEVAFFMTEVLLGNRESDYLGRPFGEERGREQLSLDLREVPELPDNLRDYMALMLRSGTWYDDARINRHYRTEILAPWVARLVNQWLKVEAKLVQAGASQEIDEHYKKMRDLASDIQQIADWAHAERLDLMRLTYNQAVHHSRRWHARFRELKAAKKAPPSNFVFVDGPWSFHELKSRAALEHEGRSQKHCVGGYWDQVHRGETEIFSVRDEKGRSKATMEVLGRILVQLRGKANAPVTNSSLLQAVSNFIAYSGYVSGQFARMLPPPTVTEYAYRANPVDDRFRYTGFNCPIVPDDVVNWSVGDWWYPTPSEEIDWQEFRDSVVLDPSEVEGTGYLPWKSGWENFEDFVARDKPEFHESFHRGELPSGTPFYVWQSSDVEHWWTPDGNMDPWAEGELIARAEEVLDEQEDVTLEDVLREVERARGVENPTEYTIEVDPYGLDLDKDTFDALWKIFDAGAVSQYFTDNAVVLARDPDGDVIGGITSAPTEELTLAVDEGWQGQGVSTEMVKRLIAEGGGGFMVAGTEAGSGFIRDLPNKLGGFPEELEVPSWEDVKAEWREMGWEDPDEE